MSVFNIVVWATIFLILAYKFIRAIRLVPTKKAYLVERLGKYHKTLGAGFHTMIPFVDRVAFIQDLREEAIPVPPQECFTSDEVQVEVDAVIYISVQDPVNASYGITNYRFAAIQLAQTTTRSVIGTLDLDRTFEERAAISSKVVEVMTDVEDNWGIKVHRYEVKNIVPPATVTHAMEKQVTAERERQAIVAKAEGDRQSRINRSDGIRTEMVNVSEGEMQRRINEAEGKAGEIQQIGFATAASVTKVAHAISVTGGAEAVRLRLSNAFLSKLRGIAKAENQVILPADLTRLQDLLGGLGLGWAKKKTKPANAAPGTLPQAKT